jgi:uncharacterized protein Usg
VAGGGRQLKFSTACRIIRPWFIWQDMDRWHADARLTYPRLRQFCDWWNKNLDGPIVQVRVGATQVITAGDLRHVGAELRLH